MIEGVCLIFTILCVITVLGHLGGMGLAIAVCVVLFFMIFG